MKTILITTAVLALVSPRQGGADGLEEQLLARAADPEVTDAAGNPALLVEHGAAAGATNAGAPTLAGLPLDWGHGRAPQILAAAAQDRHRPGARPTRPGIEALLAIVTVLGVPALLTGAAHTWLSVREAPGGRPHG